MIIKTRRIQASNFIMLDLHIKGRSMSLPVFGLWKELQGYTADIGGHFNTIKEAKIKALKMAQDMYCEIIKQEEVKS